MYFKPIKLMADRGSKTPIIDNHTPIFSWGAIHAIGTVHAMGTIHAMGTAHEGKGRFQSQCRVKVFDENIEIWDSQWVETAVQELKYHGIPFDSGKEYKWSVELLDNEGIHSQTEYGSFITALLEPWQASWIDCNGFPNRAAKYFRKSFKVSSELKRATLFVSGIGYHSVTVNGKVIDNSVLQPAFSDYSKRCYYVTLPIEQGVINVGENAIGIILGEGWRSENASYLNFIVDRKMTFTGNSQLTAQLLLETIDGEKEWIFTDKSWLCGEGAIRYSDIFIGEIFDANKEIMGWNLIGFDNSKGNFKPCEIVEKPVGQLCPQLIEPIKINAEYKPISITNPKDGIYVVDFGQNIAGVIKAVFPKMKKGTKITFRHAEMMQEDGIPYFAPLRDALATDQYIASGEENETYQPMFTYHGFRYLQIEGWSGIPDKASLKALALYTAIDTESFFNCSNQLINQIHKASIQTERANIHGITTDCPQRDERQGWLNDVTVRYEAMPYNFNVSRLFPKIIADIIDTQGEDGSITCTAPFVIGNRPADPVCSSFLIAGMQCLLHYNNLVIIQKAYYAFKAWNACLKAHTTDNLVNYSYWGDWAGPADCCIDDGVARGVSSKTPGVLMSSGYHYYNYKLLAEFAQRLGLEEEKEENLMAAQLVQEAFLKKWFDASTGVVATGSQGAQTFALWLGILPKESRELAARVLHEEVVKAGYRLTTANLCSRYIFDVLADYGYIEDAYKLIIREEYPSLGYMLANEATTIWERFELKKDTIMNSHCHPVLGAIEEWFYTRLAGIMPMETGWSKISIKPNIPEKMLYVNVVIDTIKGDVIVKWEKKYEQTLLHITIPFGSSAEVFLPSEVKNISSGYHTFEWK